MPSPHAKERQHPVPPRQYRASRPAPARRSGRRCAGVCALDHPDAGVVQRRDDPDRHVRQQLPDDAGMPKGVNRHLGGVLPGRGNGAGEWPIWSDFRHLSPLGFDQQRRGRRSASGGHAQAGRKSSADWDCVSESPLCRPFPWRLPECSAGPHRHPREGPAPRLRASWLTRAPVTAATSTRRPNSVPDSPRFDDDLAHHASRQDDVAGFLGVGDRREPDLPCAPACQPLSWSATWFSAALNTVLMRLTVEAARSLTRLSRQRRSSAVDSSATGLRSIAGLR